MRLKMKCKKIKSTRHKGYFKQHAIQLQDLYTIPKLSLLAIQLQPYASTADWSQGHFILQPLLQVQAPSQLAAAWEIKDITLLGEHATHIPIIHIIMMQPCKEVFHAILYLLKLLETIAWRT
jgi:uncharacterized protein involved in propanediol utilization